MPRLERLRGELLGRERHGGGGGGGANARGHPLPALPRTRTRTHAAWRTRKKRKTGCDRSLYSFRAVILSHCARTNLICFVSPMSKKKLEKWPAIMSHGPHTDEKTSTTARTKHGNHWISWCWCVARDPRAAAG